MNEGGLRISAGDGAAIALGVLATAVGWPHLGDLRPLPLVVLAHFFLFCNVFRVRRAYELLWAGVFVLNLLAWHAAGRVSWPGVLLVQTPVTVGVVAAQLVGGWYHGIGYSRLPAGFSQKWRSHRERCAQQQEEEQVPQPRAPA